MRSVLEAARVAAVVLSTLTVVVSGARADLFLQVAGEKGEVRVKGYEDWIQVQSFAFGASSTVAAGRAGAGAAAGRTQFTDLTITKLVDRTSPGLLTAAASGKHIPSVVLHVTTGPVDRGPTAFYRITLTDVLVTSVQVSGASDGRPVESVAFNYGKIAIEYVGQSEKGGAATPIKAGFDLKQNKPL